ncbi:MAG: hypothetical protein R3E84_09600 [Pseudomonadales bacterium]
MLIDSAVSGIRYETASQSGITNTAGEFRYLPGETVTFSLGELQLGSVSGQTEVTIPELAGVTTLPRTQQDVFTMFSQLADARPLHKAVNLAVLLQTLDADNLPGNGIEITAGVAALFGSDALTLDQDYTRFQANHRLRQILRQADADGLLTPRPLRPAGLAFQHALAEAGITRTAWYARTIETSNDGITGAETAIHRDFSPTGQLTVFANDTDADGTDDNSTSYTYDASNNLLTVSSDTNGDGDAEQVTSYTYNGFGEQLRKEVVDADGLTISLDEQQFDANGVLVYREFEQGATHTVQRWFADDAGTRTAYELDSDADGNWDRHDDLVYDAQDRLIERRIDLDNDGTVDQYHTRTWNTLGLQTSELQDNDNDGEVDVSTVWRYDTQGHLTEYLRTYPTSADKSNEQRVTYTYDTNGELTARATDNGNDETIDSRLTRSIETSETGNRVIVETWDDNGDGTTDRSVQEDYDDEDRLIRSTTTTADGAGNPVTTVTTWDYDAQGRMTRHVDGNNETLYSNFFSVDLGYLL